MGNVIRVNGGIITDQMLAGSLRFFKMAGEFAYTVSDGTVQIPDTKLYSGDAQLGDNLVVGEDRPVPTSAAEAAFHVIQKKCTVVLISVIDDTNIHFIADASAFGWEDDAEMQSEVQAIGVIDVPDNTETGTTADLGATTITEVDFELV